MNAIVIIYLIGVASGLVSIYKKLKRPRNFCTKIEGNYPREEDICGIPNESNRNYAAKQCAKCGRRKIKIRLIRIIILIFLIVLFFKIYIENRDEDTLKNIRELKTIISPILSYIAKIVGAIVVYISGLCTPYLTKVATKELKKARKRRKKKRKKKNKKKKNNG